MFFLPTAFPQVFKKIKLYCILFNLKVQSLVTVYCLAPIGVQIKAFKKKIFFLSHRQQRKRWDWVGLKTQPLLVSSFLEIPWKKPGANNGSEQAEGSLETQETKLKNIVSYFLVLHDRAYILLTTGLKINYTGKNGLFPWVFLPWWAWEFLYSWQIFFFTKS